MQNMFMYALLECLESGRGGIIAASNLESHHAQGLTAQLVLGTLRFGQSKANGNGPTWTGPIGSEHNGVCSHEDPLSFNTDLAGLENKDLFV